MTGSRDTTAGALADRLVATVQEAMTAFEGGTAPGLVLPGIYGGHAVLDDTAADLMYVLGLLAECGVSDIGGIDVRGAIPDLIAGLDPATVEGFYSYRVGETVLRVGGLGAIPAGLHDHVLAAVETPEIMARVESGDDIPPNFAVVAARVLSADARLRGHETGPELDRFVERVRSMLTSQANGWVDDGMGAWVHYDIYTPDMYLFAEPLRARLGDVWRDGLTRVLADLDEVAHPGGAVVWGRSIGALGLAITIELAATAVAHDLGPTPGRWLTRADETLDELRGWFPNGVIAAHQGRATMVYRGPPRRLQMTLDVYGKLLLAALELRRRPEVEFAPPSEAWLPGERLVVFAADRNAALWSYRSPELAFAVPLMMGFSTDYAPSPRGPGLFEHPTSGHPCMQPVISRSGRDERTGRPEEPLIPVGLPVAMDSGPGRLTVEHGGWGVNGSAEVAIEGSRQARFSVEGRTLTVHERLTLPDELPGPLTITIPELASRPLTVEVEGAPHRLQKVDTSGLAEWRSFWNELPAVHQIEIEPAADVDLTWRVTPQLRVGSTIKGHAYDTALYGPLAGRVVTTRVPPPGDDIVSRLRDIDVLHMAWPEWWSGTDPERTAAVIDLIRASATRVVWTQHNLLPHHVKTDDAAASYQLWAEAADAIIHHTDVGRRVAQATYRYGEATTHHVIPHGHWGDRYASMQRTTRAEVEAEEAWGPCALRVGVVGSPRPEKHLQLVVDAVAACERDDIQLVIRADTDTEIPDDPRIIAEVGHIEEHRYHRRLAAYDALVLPFVDSGMLTTGTAFDCIGAGVPAITSDWAFFDETFAGADIRYGSSAADLNACLEGLTADRLADARAATGRLQPAFDWADIADRTLAVLEAVGARSWT